MSSGKVPPSTAFLRAIRLMRDQVAGFESYPFSIPAIRELDQLDLDPKVTFLIGENGAGKSTLIEAIAVLAGFNAEGGTKNFNFGTRRSESSLHQFTACKTPPGPETTAAECPEINFDAFNWAVYARLHERGIADAEVGMGVCGKVNGVANDFRMSASVHDWKQADLATTVVAEELARWGLGDSFGVSIRGQSWLTLTAGR
jgi:hypothetical protein